MYKNKLTYIFCGAVAVFVAVCAIYVISGGTSTEAPVQTIANAAAPEPGKEPAEIVSTTAKEEKGGGEEVYMFADPPNYSSNPPRDMTEDEIIKLARGPGSDLEKADKLLSRIPVLNDEAKLVAMEHAVALIPDQDYNRYRQQLFSLAKNDELQEAVMVDVLSRDDTVRFTTLVEVMRKANEKAKEEVREILTAYLDNDYGPDAAAWEQPVRKFLADNED